MLVCREICTRPLLIGNCSASEQKCLDRKKARKFESIFPIRDADAWTNNDPRWMRSKALCVQVCGVIEFSIEKAPLIKLWNKGKMQSKRRLLGTMSYLQSLPSKLFWLMWDSNCYERDYYFCRLSCLGLFLSLFFFFCVCFVHNMFLFVCVFTTTRWCIVLKDG